MSFDKRKSYFLKLISIVDLYVSLNILSTNLFAIDVFPTFTSPTKINVNPNIFMSFI